MLGGPSPPALACCEGWRRPCRAQDGAWVDGAAAELCRPQCSARPIVGQGITSAVEFIGRGRGGSAVADDDERLFLEDDDDEELFLEEDDDDEELTPEEVAEGLSWYEFGCAVCGRETVGDMDASWSSGLRSTFLPADLQA